MSGNVFELLDELLFSEEIEFNENACDCVFELIENKQHIVTAFLCLQNLMSNRSGR
jgi:superfamily I DNA and RNA helicase